MTYRTLVWVISLAAFPFLYITETWSLELSEHRPFLIGEATANGLDIGQRIYSYYGAIGLAIASAFLFYYLLKRPVESLANHPFIEWIDSLLIMVILLEAASFYGINTTEGVQFLLGFALILLITGIRKNIPDILLHDYTWVILGMILTINYLLFHSAAIGIIITGLSFASFWIKKMKFHWVVFIMLLLASTPVHAFLIIETGMIMNQNGIQSIGYISILIFYLFLAVGLFYFISKRYFDLYSFTYRLIAPIVLVGIGFIQYYSPIALEPAEIFESANNSNPVMQYYLYNEIPFFDNLSSHLLSDYFWEFLYASFNGFHNDASIFVYADFERILQVIVIYYFLKHILGERPIVLLSIFFLPFIFFIIPMYFAMALIPVMALLKTINTCSTKNLFMLSLSLIFISIWRLDLGVSLISALVLFVPVWWWTQKNHRRKIFVTIITLGGILSFPLILYLQNYPLEFEQIKLYFGASQAHGYSNLYYDHFNLFVLNYYILPGIITVILVSTIFRLRQNPGSINYLIILLSLFYIFNLQRGLVRHSFMEHCEVQITSFSWLIILMFISSQFTGENRNTKWRNAIWIGSFAVSGFILSVHPASINSIFMQKSVRLSLKDVPDIKSGRITRFKINHELRQHTEEVIDFLGKNLKENQTFLDFSNSPMLYFYTGKNVPSFYNQYLQNTVTERLQEINVDQLKTFEIPYVVFAHNPETFLDHTDNIPNKVRYHWISKYIYTNYRPWKEIKGYLLWKRKDDFSVDDKLFNYPDIPEDWNLGLIPYYWKTELKGYDFRVIGRELTIQKEGIETLICDFRKFEPGSFLELTVISGSEQEMILYSDKFKLLFKIQEGKHRYRLPLGCSVQLTQNEVDELRITGNDDYKINKAEITILEK